MESNWVLLSFADWVNASCMVLETGMEEEKNDQKRNRKCANGKKIENSQNNHENAEEETNNEEGKKIL